MSSPTRRVLSSMRQHGVRYLLMGGQACITYGAAEFSRDTEIPNPYRINTTNVAKLANVCAMICTVNATRCTFCALFSSSTGTTTVAPSRGFGFSEINHSTRWRVSIFPFGWIT